MEPIACPVVQPLDPSEFVKRKEALLLLRVSSSTLQRWERDGLISPYHAVDAPDGHFTVLPGGRRKYHVPRITFQMNEKARRLAEQARAQARVAAKIAYSQRAASTEPPVIPDYRLQVGADGRRVYRDDPGNRPE